MKTLKERLDPLTEGEIANQNGRHFFSDHFPGQKQIRVFGPLSEETFALSKKTGTSRFYERPFIMLRNSRFAPVPEHTHDFIEINYMISGQCTEVIDGKTLLLEKGKMTMIDTHTPHSLGMTGVNDLMVNFLLNKGFFTHHILSKFDASHPVASFILHALDPRNEELNYLIFDLNQDLRLIGWIEDLILEFLDHPDENEELKNSLLLVILLEISSSPLIEIDTQSVTCGNKQVLQAVRYIESNYASCTLEETASTLGISPNYLSALIKKHTHLTYKEMVIKARMKAAANLLTSTNLTIEEIAGKTGYLNLTSFYKTFKSMYNCSPRTFRMKKAV